MDKYNRMIRSTLLSAVALSLGACVMADGDYGAQQPVYAPAPQPVYAPPPPVYVQQPVPVYVQQPQPVYVQPTQVIVVEAPPPLPVYEQPPCPEPGYLWTPGHWGYQGGAGYYWVPGTWAQPPQPNLYWTPAYWSRGGNGYVYHEGYWAPHVGYYGGVNYGHGYFGSGYQGGRWNNGSFQYNRTVNNVDETVVRNTYNTTVINNVTVNRNSYAETDAGAGESAEERMAQNERHFGLTNEQMQHQMAAGSNRSLYWTENRGRPAIMATPRPVVANMPPAMPGGSVGAQEFQQERERQQQIQQQAQQRQEQQEAQQRFEQEQAQQRQAQLEAQQRLQQQQAQQRLEQQEAAQRLEQQQAQQRFEQQQTQQRLGQQEAAQRLEQQQAQQRMEQQAQPPSQIHMVPTEAEARHPVDAQNQQRLAERAAQSGKAMQQPGQPVTNDREKSSAPEGSVPQSPH